MKHLVIVTPKETPFPTRLIAENLAETREWLEKHIDDGMVECAYGFVTGGGVGIVNADSAESLNEFLLDSPSFANSDIDVRPLAEIDSSLARAADAMRRAAETLGTSV